VHPNRLLFGDLLSSSAAELRYYDVPFFVRDDHGLFDDWLAVMACSHGMHML